MMWYHGQDTEWTEEGEGVMDIGTGRCVRRELVPWSTNTHTHTEIPATNRLSQPPLAVTHREHALERASE